MNPYRRSRKLSPQYRENFEAEEEENDLKTKKYNTKENTHEHGNSSKTQMFPMSLCTPRKRIWDKEIRYPIQDVSVL